MRNRPEDETHHHWIIHNFHPTSIGDVELTVDGSAFVEFELTGTFTHISYDCGKTGEYVDNEEGENNQSSNSESSNDSDEQEGDDDGKEENDNQKDEKKDEDLPEDWQYMNENDKKAYNMMKDGMSKEEAMAKIREELAAENPDKHPDDLDASA